MKLRKTLAAAGALAIAAAGFFSPGANADTGSTTATYSLTGGLLTIATPTSDSVSGGSSSLALILDLDTTTVTDNTGTLLGWDVSVNATKLVHSTDATKTIACTNLSWLTTNLQASTGGLLSGLSALASAAVFVDDATTAAPTDDCYTGLTPVVTAALGSGGGTYTYTANVTLTVPANTLKGDYSTTLTQTVG